MIIHEVKVGAADDEGMTRMITFTTILTIVMMSYTCPDAEAPSL